MGAGAGGALMKAGLAGGRERRRVEAKGGDVLEPPLEQVAERQVGDLLVVRKDRRHALGAAVEVDRDARQRAKPAWPRPSRRGTENAGIRRPGAHEPVEIDVRMVVQQGPAALVG